MKLRKNDLSVLMVLSSCKSNKLKRAIVQNADKQLVHSLCEIIDNLLSGNISIKEEDFKYLSKFKKELRNLVKRSSLQSKKKIILKRGIQEGGFLEILIPSVISGLASIIGSAISS